MQAKRIQINEENDGVSGSTTVQIFAPTSPREEANFHNIWASVSVEPQDAAANAQGTWVLFILRENQTMPTLTDSVINGETNNTNIIACGVWSAANEAPYNSGAIHPATSRTLQAGDSLVVQSVVTGITAGLASNRVMICAHVTRK